MVERLGGPENLEVLEVMIAEQKRQAAIREWAGGWRRTFLSVMAGLGLTVAALSPIGDWLRAFFSRFGG